MNALVVRRHSTDRLSDCRYEFWEGIQSHLSNPGGIVLMVVYLCVTWMFDIMPCSYYHFDGGVRWWMVFAQIVCQDLLMFLLQAKLPEHRRGCAETAKAILVD